MTISPAAASRPKQLLYTRLEMMASRSAMKSLSTSPSTSKTAGATTPKPRLHRLLPAQARL